MGMSGSYDGEGANVAAAGTTAPGPVAASPDVWKQTNGLNNAANGGQGRQSMLRTDRRGRLRVSSESARSSAAINVGGGDQVLNVCARGVYIGTAGNLVVRLADDTADATFSNLVAGAWYPFVIAIVRQTGTTAAGVLLF